MTVDSLVDINNIITFSNKPCGYDKMSADKDLIEDNPYQLIVQFCERKINHRHLCSELLDYIHPFYDGDGKTCKILFVTNFN